MIPIELFCPLKTPQRYMQQIFNMVRRRILKPPNISDIQTITEDHRTAFRWYIE